MCDIEKEINKLKEKDWLPDNENIINEIKQSIKVCIENYDNKNYKGIPAKKDIFNAFKIGDNGGIIRPEDVRILILGQDPYPNAERAHGLAFSFGDNKIPADDSLLNIFNAIQKYNSHDEKQIEEWDTNLEYWAKTNKVLLLNTALTYCKEIKKDDRMDAWRPFVKQIIINLLKSQNGKNNELVIFLWGGSARKLFNETIFDKNNKKGKQYQNEINRNILVLSTSHPSNNYDAVYKGFCYEAPNHFKACDEFLGKINGKKTWFDFPENN